MYCASGNERCQDSRRGFTLLEVMLAVAVLALITISIYRFVQTDITSIRLSTEEIMRRTEVQNLATVLESELGSLPPAQSGAIIGQAHMFNDKASDEITWLTGAGNGIFTMEADGAWKVTLELRPQEKSPGFALGLVRERPDNKDVKAENWLPLIRDVDALEIRYFDHRLGSWLEKWSDQNSRPNLVRLRVWRMNAAQPYEKIIKLPPTRAPGVAAPT